MVVTEYDPPRRWVTAKDGDLLRGVGIMQVEPLANGCRVTWANELELPFGIARPARLARSPGRSPGSCSAASLRRLARKLVSGELPLPAAIRR